jgi:hypothetical protein
MRKGSATSDDEEVGEVSATWEVSDVRKCGRMKGVEVRWTKNRLGYYAVVEAREARWGIGIFLIGCITNSAEITKRWLGSLPALDRR